MYELFVPLLQRQYPETTDFYLPPEGCSYRMAVVSIKKSYPCLAKDQPVIGIEGSAVRIESKPEAKRQYKATYELPQDIDASASVASLENGVLTLKPISPLKGTLVGQQAHHGSPSQLPSTGCQGISPVSYTHLRAHETDSYLVC